MTDALLTDQMTTAAIIIYVLQWLKKSKVVPWITADTKGLNRFLAALGAAAGTAGITFQLDTVSGTLMITGLLLPNLLTFTWQFLQTWAMTQAGYSLFVEPNRKVRPIALELPSSLPKAGA